MALHTSLLVSHVQCLQLFDSISAHSASGSQVRLSREFLSPQRETGFSALLGPVSSGLRFSPVTRSIGVDGFYINRQGGVWSHLLLSLARSLLLWSSTPFSSLRVTYLPGRLNTVQICNPGGEEAAAPLGGFPDMGNVRQGPTDLEKMSIVGSFSPYVISVGNGCSREPVASDLINSTLERVRQRRVVIDPCGSLLAPNDLGSWRSFTF